ncbi:hypothetical protein ABT076_10670 [Streptomyces sp. NPDC002131]|uniref:hypothetical protein n=1 Tax=Streptomyces sp. NPDC002131 TaxID=3154535 RepID=UPI0033303A2E
MTTERAGTPGRNWDTVLVTTETAIADAPEATTVPGMNDPLPPRPNRATRRAMQRAARRNR